MSYTKFDNGVIFNGDCLELMRNLPDKSIDMIITSPPYKIGKKYDESIDYNNLIADASKKLKDNGIFIWQVGNQIKDGFVYPIDLETHPIFVSLGFKLINRIIWSFNHGLHCKNRLSGRYETVCVYARDNDYTFNLDSIRVPQKYPNKKYFKGNRKGQLSCNPLGKNPGDVWQITNVKHNHPEKVDFPCQYPLDLIVPSIKAFSNENDTILDPFSGSGTTAIACINTNRNFICMEKEEKYYEISVKRIEEHKKEKHDK